MISSTTLDLREHRDRAKAACRSAGVEPIAMEERPAQDRDAITFSKALVDQANIFIGIYGARYGTVVKAEERSLTELELDRALERRMTVLAFIADRDHLWKLQEVERTEEAAQRLAALKQRAQDGRYAKDFRSARHLEELILEALTEVEPPLLTAAKTLVEILGAIQAGSKGAKEALEGGNVFERLPEISNYIEIDLGKLKDELTRVRNQVLAAAKKVRTDSERGAITCTEAREWIIWARERAAHARTEHNSFELITKFTLVPQNKQRPKSADKLRELLKKAQNSASTLTEEIQKAEGDLSIAEYDVRP